MIHMNLNDSSHITKCHEVRRSRELSLSTTWNALPKRGNKMSSNITPTYLLLWLKDKVRFQKYIHILLKKCLIIISNSNMCFSLQILLVLLCPSFISLEEKTKVKGGRTIWHPDNLSNTFSPEKSHFLHLIFAQDIADNVYHVKIY